MLLATRSGEVFMGDLVQAQVGIPTFAANKSSGKSILAHITNCSKKNYFRRIFVYTPTFSSSKKPNLIWCFIIV